MRKYVFLLWILLLAQLLTLSACNGNEIADASASPDSGVLTTVSPVSGACTTASPRSCHYAVQNPSVQETANYTYLDAQCRQDWQAVFCLWTNMEQVFYKDFFADTNNTKNHIGYFAIKNVSVSAVKEIENVPQLLESSAFFQLPYAIESAFDYRLDDQYKDIKMFVVKSDYSLFAPAWDYTEGTNYRVIVLVPEAGGWKIAQDYQGYPDAAQYFGDTVPEATEEDDTAPDTESEKKLKDGTVHFTKIIEGYFTGTAYGDYLHIEIKTITGEKLWFFIADRNFDWEAAIKPYQKLKIEWENIDVYIDEAERVINIDRAIKITPI
jgi:hypothetical protein